MKTLFVTLAYFVFSSIGLAQSFSNVQSVQVNNNTDIDLAQASKLGILSIGRMYDANAGGACSAGVGYTVTNNNIFPAASRKFIIKRIHIEVNLACTVQLNYGYGSANLTPPITPTTQSLDNYWSSLLYSFPSATGGRVTLETPGMTLAEGNKLGSLQVIPTGTVKPDVRVMVEYYDMTWCWQSRGTKKNVLLLGDSITESSSMGTDPNGVSYYGESSYWGRMYNYLDSLGKGVNIINKAVAGTTAVGTAYMVKYGNYIRDIDFNLAIIAVGTNDASRNNTQGLVETWLTTLVAEVRKARPNADIILIAPPTLDNVSYTANIATMRTAVQNVANATNAKFGYVYFYDASTAFSLNANAAADRNFTNLERNTGARLHPSGEGHRLIWNGLKTVLTTTRFFNALF